MSDDLFDLSKLTPTDIYELVGPASDLTKLEGAAGDGWHTFAQMKAALERCGYHFYGPGEHPLPTRFAVRRGDKPFTRRSTIRDLCQAWDLVTSYGALNDPRHIKIEF